MGFLETLKTLIEVKLNLKLENVSLINVNIVNGTKKEPVTHDSVQNKYIIDISKLDKKEYETIGCIAREYVENNKMLLEDKSLVLLDELYNFRKQSNSTLEFFEGIIPQTDFQALRASMFIKAKFQKGETINDLKRDVIMRFGDRGRNICNLCSAGYFEEFLIPLYNIDKDKFDGIYSDFVASSMLAVFVNSAMVADDIPEELERKISISKRYGFKFIHVHGIGQKNISTIKEFINSKRTELFNIEKICYANPEEHILIVELILS